MKVAELIAELQEMDPNLPVYKRYWIDGATPTLKDGTIIDGVGSVSVTTESLTIWIKNAGLQDLTIRMAVIN